MDIIAENVNTLVPLYIIYVSIHINGIIPIDGFDFTGVGGLARLAGLKISCNIKCRVGKELKFIY